MHTTYLTEEKKNIRSVTRGVTLISFIGEICSNAIKKYF